MEHTKGKLHISTNPLFIVDKQDRPVAVCQARCLDKTSVKEATTTARLFVRGWNAFNEGGLVDDLLTVCEASLAWLQDAPMSELEAIEKATEKSTPESLLRAVIAKADT